MYTFVTGGYRSGRSNYALRRASELGPPPWLYAATGLETDDAIRKRLERQRRDVGAVWRTAVMPARLLDVVDAARREGYGSAVLDGVPAWIQQQLDRANSESTHRDVLAEIDDLANQLYRSPLPIVIVSGEMGLGVAPDEGPARDLLRVVTSANQILARQAATVVLMVSGIPFKVS